MFIMTAKLTKGKAIAGTVLGGIIFCALIFAAEGHKDGSRADGGVEALGKAAL